MSAVWEEACLEPCCVPVVFSWGSRREKLEEPVMSHTWGTLVKEAEHGDIAPKVRRCEVVLQKSSIRSKARFRQEGIL